MKLYSKFYFKPQPGRWFCWVLTFLSILHTWVFTF